MRVDVSDGAGLRSKSPGKGHRTPHELPHSHGETSVVMVCKSIGGVGGGETYVATTKTKLHHIPISFHHPGSWVPTVVKACRTSSESAYGF